MTAQRHEIVILSRKPRTESSMAFCPPLPHHLEVLVEREFSENDEAGDENSADRDLLNSTACWRRYQATWEIRNDCFYLVSVQGRYRLESTSPILADWFSGVLRIPEGELLQYVHMGFGSVYEFEKHIKIENGRVITSRTVDNRGKPFDEYGLAMGNLPGRENYFEGDDF